MNNKLRVLEHNNLFPIMIIYLSYDTTANIEMHIMACKLVVMQDHEEIWYLLQINKYAKRCRTIIKTY